MATYESQQSDMLTGHSAIRRAKVIRTSLRVGPAGLKGMGLFAKTRIAPLLIVATHYGTPRWIWDIPEKYWSHTFQVDYDRYVMPRKNSMVWFINHSCNPNCVVRGRSILTARQIERDEELTFDYSTDVDWPDYRMECRCGSANCRKVVRAYRFIPKKLKRNYGGNIADYIARQYGRASANPTSTWRG
jgi:hypothetical protein